MVVSAFAKRLRKNPPPDESILASLMWIERMIGAVRGESEISDLPSMDDVPEIPMDEDELTRPETDALV